jgi:NADH-quinone oxidoreductase subunit N
MMMVLLPEIGLLVLIGLVLALDLIWKKRDPMLLGWVTFCGILLLAVINLVFVRPPDQPQLLWGNMVRFDSAGFVFSILFLTGAGLTTLLAIQDESMGDRGEFYVLLLTSTLGMVLMACAADLILLFLAIETTSIPLFALAGFFVHDQKSIESGIKYFLFGAMASAIMLYGFSLLYGFAGTTQIYAIAEKLSGMPFLPMIAALLLVLVGFGFKMSIVPFHFWAPDVYEGSPTPVAGFLSTASKAAGFAVLMRVFGTAFPNLVTNWMIILAILATLSMFLGNFLALAQKNIKRLLAYSSIAQAGYMLIGVAAHNALGLSGTIYYLIAYLVTNLAAFGIVTIVGRSIGSDEISAYAGLSRRSPGMALAMLAAMLSLGGIPPFAGFIGKLLVFASAIQADMVWLALIGIINAIISLYYYLNILKVIYLYRGEGDEKPMPVARPWGLALGFCILGVIVLGIVVAPGYGWATKAATALLGF